MRKLPNKLSDLIIVALEDEAKAHRSNRYEIDMDYFHMPESRGMRTVCRVCLAGAVMAFSLGAPFDFEQEPHMFDDENKLLALDCIREGRIEAACDYFYGSYQSYWVPFEWPYSSYKYDRNRWRNDMREIAKYLRIIGL